MVGKIAYPIVGFAGELEAGKSSCAAILERRGYIRMRFAKYLKAMIVAAGVDERHVDGTPADKAEQIHVVRDRAPMEVARDMLAAIGVDVNHPYRPDSILMGRTPNNACELMVQIDLFSLTNRGFTTGRQLMQLLGTEWGREIHPDFWVALWLKEAEPILRSTRNITIEDVRFPNEIAAIHDCGGIVIGIDRVGDAKSEAIQEHKSEGYRKLKCDGKFVNHKTGFEKLEANIDEALVLVGKRKTLPSYN